MEDRITAIEARLQALEEKWPRPEQLVDHKGVAVVAGEGLRGGGTIEHTGLGLALDTEGLEVGSLDHLTEEVIVYYSKQHFRVQVAALAEAVKRALNIPSAVAELPLRVEELKVEVSRLREKIELVGLHKSLLRLSRKVEELEEKMEEPNAVEK